MENDLSPLSPWNGNFHSFFLFSTLMAPQYTSITCFLRAYGTKRTSDTFLVRRKSQMMSAAYSRYLDTDTISDTGFRATQLTL